MKMYDLPKKLSSEALRLADKELRDNHACGIFSDGDPNHPKFNGGINYITGKPDSIFGYETRDFMARQYRGAE